MATASWEVKIDSRQDEATNTKQTWLNDCDGKGVRSLNELQPLFDNPRGVGSDKASRLAGTLAIYMLLWPRNFPTDRTVLAAGFWLRSSASNGTDVRRNAKKDRTLARWRAALKDLTAQIMARAGVDRACASTRLLPSSGLTR